MIIADSGTDCRQRNVPVLCRAPEPRRPPRAGSPARHREIKFGDLLLSLCVQLFSRKTVRAPRVNIFQPQVCVYLRLCFP